MGAVVSRGTKQRVVRELLRVQGSPWVIASRLIGNRLWYLARAVRNDGSMTTWIGLTVVEGRRGEVIVRSMDEFSGPFYYDCPLAFLAQADVAAGPFAIGWREQVKVFHATRAARYAAIRPGARVRHGTQVFLLLRSRGRRGWKVRRESDGVGFHMTNRQLAQAEVLPVDTASSAKLERKVQQRSLSIEEQP